jgi:hypothetical protein
VAANEAEAQSAALGDTPDTAPAQSQPESIGESATPSLKALALDVPVEPTAIEIEVLGDQPKSETPEVGESAVQSPEPQPEVPTPVMLEFASDQPQIEPGDSAAETGLA